MTGSNIRNASPLLVILAFATIYIVWGSTYFFILIALKGFPPMMLGALRFLIAGLLMLGWCFARGEKIFVLKDMKHAAVSGLLMLFVGTGMVIWVEQYLASALVAILVSADPMWFVLMDKPKWKENFTNKSTIAGLIFGFIGIVLLFKEKISNAFSGSNSYIEIGSMLLIVIGSLSWTAGSLYSKYRGTSGSNTVNVAWQIIAAGIPFIPLSFLLGEPQHLQWQTISAHAWFSLFYLIIFGSIAAYTAYVWLLQVRSATQVSTFAYVNPVVAVLLGVFFASENISFLQITGLVVILVSVLLINLAKYRN
ncbi:MAG TPA: EamA family transporter [Bacteroidia bacterium]|nr:EamA family transporter [Bacteroidia bacterium]